MNVIVSVTAASGAIYARLLLEQLVAASQVERIALIFSQHAQEVAASEGENFDAFLRSTKVQLYQNDNLWASPASGSARWDAMVVVPSSVGTVGRVASGVSQTLIERAADVMLKERRRLIFVVRETPYSLIHLRNMTTLTEAGAVILPATPSFYSLPKDIEAVCQTVTERITAMLGIEGKRYEWGE
jgi:4-hydroxy-3-polyprenylbenzoate decarboxylase